MRFYIAGMESHLSIWVRRSIVQKFSESDSSVLSSFGLLSGQHIQSKEHRAVDSMVIKQKRAKSSEARGKEESGATAGWLASPNFGGVNFCVECCGWADE